MPLEKMEDREVLMLPNGCRLYARDNKAGGTTYWSDEIGGGVMVWDTCLVKRSTLIAALFAEEARELQEFYDKHKPNEKTN